MQFNVAQLLKDSIGSVRQFELVEDIDELDQELETLGPLVGSVNLMRTHSGVMVTAALSTAVRVTCNRCLEPIAMPVRLDFEECFRPLTEVSTGRYIAPEEFEGTTEELEDEALLINEQHILDISEVVRQRIWTMMPLSPGCNWSGEGQCPNLTAFLDSISEGHQEIEVEMSVDDPEQDESVDPRWSALLELKNSLGKTD